MITKRILVPGRLRRPPATGWSWMDGRFVRQHMDHLSREAVLLYFFLCAVGDQHGLSFYSDGTLATLLRMTLPALIQARDELLARVSVTVSEGTTFSARWGPVRNDWVSVRWYPAGWLGSLADRL